MTVQSNVGLIWAGTGGVTDPGDIKYATGWVAEIPTFQNFNFVLQNHSKNLAVLAEQGTFGWEAGVAYKSGTPAIEAGITYYCVLDHSGQQPSLDTSHQYWGHAPVFGSGVPTGNSHVVGLTLIDVNGRTATAWEGSDVSIRNANALIQFNTTAAGTKNLLMGNIAGEAVVVDVGTTILPDGRSIALTDPNSHRIFHEGHHPTIAEVTDGVEEAPQNSKLYARTNASWIEVTTTTVSTAPPPPVRGAGQGWYNLDTGQFYLDINDGNSSQWVQANVPVIPGYYAIDVVFDPSTSNLVSITVQEAIVEVNAKSVAILAGDTDVYTRENSTGEVGVDTGGNPTGAILEEQTNANGSYIKYSGGSMICTGHALQIDSYGEGTEVVFPAGFASGTDVSITASVDNTSTALTEAIHTEASSTDAYTGLVKAVLMEPGAFLSLDNTELKYTAIGRWF